jgi:hypothetical protein
MDTADTHSTLSFSLAEKFYAQITFHGGILVGAYGLFLNSTALGIAYLLYAYIGIILLMRYTVCPRCPHLLVADDCVQLHPKLTKKIISPNHTGSLSLTEKIIFVSVLYGILILPIYWIASNTIILILFLLLYGGQLLGLHLHFCPKCENKICIQYRKPIKNEN